MYNRFRDLERPSDGQRLDVVLMAAVTGFEDLTRPTRHDLKQFAELFTPLFADASRPARRTAVAALSRCPMVPDEVIAAIARQDTAICAPFLATSAALDDAHILRIVETSGASHARALARRRALSGPVVAALAATGDAATLRSLRVRRLLPAAIDPDAAGPPADTPDASDALRDRLRALAGSRSRGRPDQHTAPLPTLSPEAAQRLRRFAENGEPVYFATALADALESSIRSAEQIMLDISGHQLAETLTALGLDRASTTAALEAFFPHLRRKRFDRKLSELVLDRCDRQQAAERVRLRLRIDGSAVSRPEHLPQVVDGRNAPQHTASPHGQPRQGISVSRSYSRKPSARG